MVSQETRARESCVEVTLEVRDPGLFFVRASGRASCRVALAEMVHRSDGGLLEYFTVAGATPDGVLSAAAAAPEIDDARVVREAADELLVEFVVSGPCIGETLAQAGAVVREAVARNGVGTVVADVPPHVDASAVVALVGDRHEAELQAQRQRDRPAPDFTRQSFRATLVEQLTDRQFEALRTAWAGGYFEWPRESTAEECADALGISQPTFTEHIRVAQRKLLLAVFDTEPDDGPPTATARSSMQVR